MRRFFLFLMPIVTIASGPVIVFASAPQPEDAPLLVISSWGERAFRIIENAGGHVIGPVSAPLGVFALSNNPDFADLLRAQGAWAVINGGRIAAICGVES